jgi:hypothetical protein
LPEKKKKNHFKKILNHFKKKKKKKKILSSYAGVKTKSFRAGLPATQANFFLALTPAYGP